MTQSTLATQNFLAGVAPFDLLSAPVLESLVNQSQVLRYRMGQAIASREVMPDQITVVMQGQVRLLGIDPRNKVPVTLKRLEPGAIIGAVSLVRGVPCETAIASTEVVCLNLPTEAFLRLCDEEPAFASFRQQPSLIELFDLLGTELTRRADGITNLADLARSVEEESVVKNLPQGKLAPNQLDSDWLWLVSSNTLAAFPAGSRLSPAVTVHLDIPPKGMRLLGVPKSALAPEEGAAAVAEPEPEPESDWQSTIPYAPELSTLNGASNGAQPGGDRYPLVRGRGPMDGSLACFQMLSQYFNVPFRRDIIQRVLSDQLKRSGSFSLQFCGAVAELMGLTAQMVKVPASAVSRLQTPVMIAWQDSFALVYHATQKEIVLASPETGLVRRKPQDFAESWGEEGEVLLLQSTKDTPKDRFSLRWFLPSIKRYRRVLIEVLIASMFVQLFGLVNPLVTQVIIDKVLIGNSPDTLEVLGIFLIVVAIAESILTSLRTHLFVDTTNRIDVSLGSEVINHLLRLPLSYFDRRPVGELATRVNELENIRQFLTGTALTVVLDAIFSVIYIVVMMFYSWLLTLVALATVPLFALLTLLVSPILRQQSREKAERNAITHAYLVEVLTGVQTVKAQNLELRSRWHWQDRYANYISAGFKTVSTQTTASSISGFLSKFSSLLVLWVGAYLVLNQQLTLGQLIAFRIISGYVTSPLLRLVQLWQNFQETALSLERLSDILDAPLEAEEDDRQNILMPAIKGSVRYEAISFSFKRTNTLQLNNINLDFPAGSFIGIVGQSGSGKSTLLKLLPRLYDPQSGRILVDGYDIAKVELYSLRRQIGMVLQDTLLFDGTVRENIALAVPDATDEQIIEAATVACAHDFIMSLPSGYNSRVGERGASLSGGQRQRIAIARTVLQNPRLLILDEATSALDYNTERQVCLNLAEAFKGRTVFFITHRLSAIRHADTILMMDQGTIAEQGTHDELMALKGAYYCLYQQQEAQM